MGKCVNEPRRGANSFYTLMGVILRPTSPKILGDFRGLKRFSLLRCSRSGQKVKCKFDKGGRLRPPLYLSAITLLRIAFFEQISPLCVQLEKIDFFYKRGLHSFHKECIFHSINNELRGVYGKKT